jgi:broad specificity phosphatase PhoE
MSRMLVVRHGQASFGTRNYDTLSQLGIRQSQRLGAWLAQRSVQLDAIWCGPMRRQIDTATAMVAAAAEAGRTLPAPVVIDEFREVSLSMLAKRVLPQLQLQTRVADEGMPAAAHWQVEAVEAALQAWALRRVTVTDFESFDDFEARIRRALATVTKQARTGHQVAVVTSAGPLAMLVREALGLDGGVAMKLGSAAVNTGLSCFGIDAQRRLSLESFNTSDHLAAHETTHR